MDNKPLTINTKRAQSAAAGLSLESGALTHALRTTESGDGQFQSVMWFAVGIWIAAKRLTPKELTAAVMAADAVLEMNAPGTKLSVEIPHLGQCSYARCAAIVAVFICMMSRTDHVDSPILAAAREAKILAGQPPFPATEGH